MKRSAVITLGAVALLVMGASSALAANYVAQAKHLLATGDLQGARIELQNAVRQDPKDGAAQYALGKLELEFGNPAAAAQQARNAKADGYDAGRSLSLLLDTYFLAGQPGQLLKDFPEVKGAPDIASRVAVARGRAEMSLGELDQAASDFAAARHLAPKSPGPLLGEADLDIARHDLTSAMHNIDLALALAPESNQVLLHRAQLFLISGKPKDALAALNQILARSPSDMRARLFRVQALLATGQDAAAKTELGTVLKVSPGSAEGLYLAAVIRAQGHDYKGASEILQKLSPVLGRIPKAYFLQAEVMAHLGQIGQAQVAAQRYVGRFPDDARGVRLLADLDLRGGDVKGALTALKTLSPAEQAKPETIELQGLAHGELGDLQAAAKDFEKVSKLSPSAALPLAQLGAVQVGLGNPVKAIAELQMALILRPKDAPTRRRLILIAIKAGRYDLAQSNLAVLKKQFGDTAEDDNLEGLLQSSQGNLKGARATFRALVREHPKFTPGVFNLARLERDGGDVGQAENLLEGVLARQPANATALKALTPMLLAEKKTDKAVQILRRAHTMAPKNVSILDELALLEIRLKEPQKALALIDQSTELTARYPAVLLLIKTQAEVALGDTMAAKNSLNSLVQVAPKDIGARLSLASFLIHEKEYAAAHATLEAGLGVMPHSYALMQALVGVKYAQGGLSAALKEAKNLAADSRYQPESRSLEGDLYAVKKHPHAAARSYAAALKADPSSLALTLRYSTSLQNVGQEDKAIQVLKRYLTKHPGTIQIMLVLSSFDLSSGRLDAAAKQLSAVLAVAPNNVAALNNLAWIEQKKGRPEARSLAERAYFVSPNGHTADTLGWILVQGHSNSAGLSLLRVAHAALPQSSTVTYHFAVALNEAGDSKAAEALLHPIVAGKSDFAEKAAAQTLLAKLTGKP